MTDFSDLSEYSLPEQFRQAAARSTRRFSTYDPIKSMTMVGGLFLDLEGMRGADSRIFSRLFDYLIKSGIAVSPDLKITLKNFLLDEKNYLDDTSMTDMTVISYVPMTMSAESQFALEEQHTIHNDRLHGPMLLLGERFRAALQKKDYYKAMEIGSEANPFQPAANSPAEWKKRLGDSGSRLLVSLINALEVDLNLVTPDGYVPLGAVGKERVWPDDAYAVKDISLDQPLRWQMAGYHDFVEESVIAVAGHKTFLADAITREAFKLFEEEDAAPARPAATPSPKAKPGPKNGD